MFHNLLIHTNINFCLGYIAVYCFFETFPAGWVVGKSDFNENPVVLLIRRQFRTISFQLSSTFSIVNIFELAKCLYHTQTSRCMIFHNGKGQINITRTDASVTGRPIFAQLSPSPAQARLSWF